MALTAAYAVRASADPHVVLRLLNFFAQRDLVPDAVRVRRLGDEIGVVIEQPGVSEHTATVIAEKMRSLVAVSSVELECRLMRAAA